MQKKARAVSYFKTTPMRVVLEIFTVNPPASSLDDEPLIEFTGTISITREASDRPARIYFTAEVQLRKGREPDLVKFDPLYGGVYGPAMELLKVYEDSLLSALKQTDFSLVGVSR